MKSINEIFNVGSGQTYSVNTLIKLLGKNKVVNIPKDQENQIVLLLIFQKFLKKLNGGLKFHLKMALKNLWNLLTILKMHHYGIQNQLKMKQKIGLSTYHRLKFKSENGNKKYF